MIRKQEITTFTYTDDAVIWDVREAKSYAEGHIKGAVNRPIDSLDDTVLAQVAADQPIYILCGGGSKAPRAAEKLQQIDPDREYVVLMGGTRAARAAGMAIEEGE